MRNPISFANDHRLRPCLLILCLLVSCRPALPANDSSIAPQYIRTDFTVEDGLPNNTVNIVTQTDNGLLWVGTDSGLASFDGRTFTPVPLPIHGAAPMTAINTLVEGPDGDLWVGGDAGVVRIPKRDLNDSEVMDSVAFRLGDQQSDEVEVLFKDRDGVIWAGTNHGLYRFDGNRFLLVLPSYFISRINQALNGRLMLTTNVGFVEYGANGEFAHHELGAVFGVHDDQIFDVFQDSGGTIWYCTNKGIHTLDGHHALSLNPDKPAHTAAFRITAGPDGSLWVSTGIGVYRVSGGLMSTPAPNLHARSLFVAKDNDLWIGTNGAGLVHLHPRFIRMYTSADGLPSNDIAMTVLPAQDGRLWVGSNCGLSVLEGDHIRNFFEKDGLKNSCVWSLAEDQEHSIWIGTWGGGLFQYREGVFRQYTTEQGLASNVVFKILVAGDDSLWIATPDGVSHLLANAIQNYTTADGLSSTQILDIHQDHAGTLWVATQAGVDRLISGRFVRIPVPQSAAEVLARRFVEDSHGNLYTANAPQGISEIKNNQLIQVNSALDLMDMVESPDHTLWFSSRNGVVRIREDEFARSDNTSVPLDYEVFNRADGLNTTQASAGATNIAMGSDGKLWIATVKGLAMIDTSHVSFSGRPSKVFVSGAGIDGQRRPVEDGLVLRPGMHHVELHLAAIDLANPQEIRLQYRLEGVDPGWLDATSSRQAVYTNIPEGEHRLLVRATDSIGHWSAPEIVYEVTQQPHFFATPAFQVSSLIALCLMLFLAYIIRVRYVVKQTQIILEQRQVEREAVARDLHDTFLQGVQGLILRFHTGTQQLPPESPVRRSFEEALSESDHVMLEGRSVLSRLRTKKIKPESLTDVYASLGDEFQSLGSVNFRLVLTGRKRDLDIVVQEELLKIGREAVFNAYRHAKANTIEVEIHFGLFNFRVRFRDDGVGVDQEIIRKGSLAGHYGLPGMRERASKIGGHLEVWSRPGAGTEIEVRIPGAIAYRQSEGNQSSGWIRRLRRSRVL